MERDHKIIRSITLSRMQFPSRKKEPTPRYIHHVIFPHSIIHLYLHYLSQPSAFHSPLSPKIDMRLPIRPILRSIHASPITLPRYHKSFPKTNPVTLTQIRAYGERAPIATKEDDIRLEKKSIAEEFELKQSLDPLLLENGGKWELASDGMGIRRAFTFRYFKDAWVSSSFHLSFSQCEPF